MRHGEPERVAFCRCRILQGSGPADPTRLPPGRLSGTQPWPCPRYGSLRSSPASPPHDRPARSRASSSSCVRHRLAKLPDRLEHVAAQEPARHDDPCDTSHARRQRMPLSADHHSVIVYVGKRAERVTHATGTDPTDRRAPGTVALVGKRVVEELHALAGPGERHATLREFENRLQSLAATHDLCDAVPFCNHGTASAHGELDDRSGTGGDRREAISAVDGLFVQDPLADLGPLKFVEEALFLFARRGLAGFEVVTALRQRPLDFMLLARHLLQFNANPLFIHLGADRIQAGREPKLKYLVLFLRHLMGERELLLLEAD